MATSRTTRSSAFSFAWTDLRSKRRSAFWTSESRWSAIHGTPVSRLTAAPIRFIESGGLVVITASMPSLLTIRTAAGIAVGAQVTLASGSSSRRPMSRALASARSRPSSERSSSEGSRAFGPR